MRRDPQALENGVFDLLVIGGGITGAGVALDAVTRGLRVALIDKQDFAAGTSSASSKLIHGGLRYLERGDFRLVHEALQERRRLLHNAPHLVRPLRFVIPFCRGARISPLQWRLGLTLYDAFAGRNNLRRSRPLPMSQLQREFPSLRPAGLRGGASYWDAQVDDARLCIEVLKTASSRGAVVANYIESLDFAFAGVTAVHVCDRATARDGESRFTVRARQVVNATGPWADTVRRLAGDAGNPLLQPTKGVHLVVPSVGIAAAFLLLHPADGRVLFVLPWMGKTLIGTTDTITEQAPDGLAVEPAEVQYLLAAYNHYFTPSLMPAEVLGSFAGLRPLVRASRGEPSALSRECRLHESPSGLISVAGGKYTTYRAMAEAVVDLVCRRLGLERRCKTHDLLLDATPDEPWDRFAAQTVAELENRWRLPYLAASHLVDRYGRNARKVAEYLDAAPELAMPVTPGEPELQVEFAYQRECEMALYDDDYRLRRTRLGLIHPDKPAGQGALPRLLRA
jgi:glycerol-3-phosphate dehydrogenase